MLEGIQNGQLKAMNELKSRHSKIKTVKPVKIMQDKDQSSKKQEKNSSSQNKNENAKTTTSTVKTTVEKPKKESLKNTKTTKGTSKNVSKTKTIKIESKEPKNSNKKETTKVNIVKKPEAVKTVNKTKTTVIKNDGKKNNTIKVIKKPETSKLVTKTTTTVVKDNKKENSKPKTQTKNTSPTKMVKETTQNKNKNQNVSSQAQKPVETTKKQKEIIKTEPVNVNKNTQKTTNTTTLGNYDSPKCPIDTRKEFITYQSQDSNKYSSEKDYMLIIYANQLWDMCTKKYKKTEELQDCTSYDKYLKQNVIVQCENFCCKGKDCSNQLEKSKTCRQECKARKEKLVKAYNKWKFVVIGDKNYSEEYSRGINATQNCEKKQCNTGLCNKNDLESQTAKNRLDKCTNAYLMDRKQIRIQYYKDFCVKYSNADECYKKSYECGINGLMDGVSDAKIEISFRKPTEKEVEKKKSNLRIQNESLTGNIISEDKKIKSEEIILATTNSESYNYILVSCFTGWGTRSIKYFNEYVENEPTIDICKNMFPSNSDYSVESLQIAVDNYEKNN